MENNFYAPGVDIFLPKYVYQEHKPHSSKVWSDRICFGRDMRTGIITHEMSNLKIGGEDMEKGGHFPGVSLAKSPSIVGGKTELFRDI